MSASTAKLAAALKNLPESYLAQASITPTEINNAGQILTVFIDFYLDYRRRQVLEQVVPVMEPIVTKLCTKFGQDFDVDQAGFAQVYYNTADRILDRAGTVSSGDDFQHRAIVQPIFQRADAIRTKASVTFASVSKAAQSCVKSSQALRKAIEDPNMSFDDILDFANKAEAAYSAVHAAVSAK